MDWAKHRIGDYSQSLRFAKDFSKIFKKGVSPRLGLGLIVQRVVELVEVIVEKRVEPCVVCLDRVCFEHLASPPVPATKRARELLNERLKNFRHL